MASFAMAMSGSAAGVAGTAEAATPVGLASVP